MPLAGSYANSKFAHQLWLSARKLGRSARRSSMSREAGSALLESVSESKLINEVTAAGRRPTGWVDP